MNEERVIVHGIHRHMNGDSLCADVDNGTVLLTAYNIAAEVQMNLAPADARRLGEWLIKRANEGGGDRA